MNKPLTIEDWTVVSVGQTQTIGSTGFQKRELVITNGDKYPQYRMIEAKQDKCADLDNISKGDKVTINFWYEGRAWTNPEGVVKYYNSDKLASIKKTAHDWDQSVKSSIDLISGTENAYSKNQAKNKDEDDDLPF